MGAPAPAAGEVARHLVGANLRGHDSHGVLRMTQYVAEMDAGLLVPAAQPRIVRDGGATAVVDAGRGFGQFSTLFAMDCAVTKARGFGVSALAVRRSMHIGRLGHYTEPAARKGMAAIVTLGSAGPGTGLVAPFGGAERFLGTNPWSIAIPAKPRPFVFDAASSAIAEGKARFARAAAKQLPEGAVRDASGRLTRDPADLYEGGMLLPLGGELSGHKGTGLALAAALLGGLAMIDDSAPTIAGTMRQPESWGDRLAGVLIVVVDSRRFGSLTAYRSRVSRVLAAVREVRPDTPGGRTLAAGDPEQESLERRSEQGILIPEATWEELAALGTRFGVPLPAG